MIPLGDVVLRDDLDPRLGQRDGDLIQQYAEIFDELPPIEINQDKELIDGWHRVRAAERAGRSEIAYIVVETTGDDDLSDKMWAANLKHGVQYTRVQRQTQGLKLHGRGLKAKAIAERCGVGVNSVYRWTKELREKEKAEREHAVLELAKQGKTQQEIAGELGVPQQTISRIVTQNPQMVKMGKSAESDENTGSEPESETISVDEPAPDDVLIHDGEAPEANLEEITDAKTETGEPEPASVEAPRDEEAAAPEPELEPATPEEIPEHILETARAVMDVFTETRPDDYVARLEASASEWMTITDDSLSNELERELLTSAAAMCLWQEWMVWYQGERTSAFTNVFGKIGPVFVRGQAGQWRIVSRLRSILKRLWA